MKPKKVCQNTSNQSLITGSVLTILVCLSIGLSGALMAQSASQAASTAHDAAKILVGPNMLVSRDGDFPHMETSIAVNPRNKKNLVGASITSQRGEGGFACKTYASFDGGSSWVDSPIAEQFEWGGADPQVAFGPQGTAYFTSLAFVKDENGNERGGLFFYRSEDGGKTWRKPANLGYSYDHEVMVVDHSFGKYAGRIYISVLYGEYPEYTVGIFRSDDDGRTFTGPVDAASGKKILGINTAANILLFRDGTLFLPYEDFEYDPERSKKSHSGNVWFVTSSDGGVTFSSPSKIGTQEHRPYNEKEPAQAVESTFPAFAIDSSDVYPDRIYMTWTDYRSGEYRVYVAYSSDMGKTWTTPRQIDPAVPQYASQYQSMVTVNKEGVVGVTWFDTRNAPNHDNQHYDEYFAASLDGGETFSQPVRVSAVTSSPFGKGNVRMQASYWKTGITHEDDARLSFLSAAARWPAGGDYLGLTADRDGIFHPFWADARTGTFQLQTAAITVVKPAAAPKPGAAAAGSDKTGEQGAQAKKPEPAQSRVNVSVLGKVEMVFDPTSFDASTGILEVPIRIRNVSNATIYAPITVEVTKFGSGMGDELKDFAPKILNSTNGKDGSGAKFDYSSALGTSQALAPGGLSGEVVWRIKVQDPMKIPDFHLSMEGMVAEVK